jgi:excisionase family DNA binding protein
MLLMTPEVALLTTSQAAERLRIGVSTVRRWAKEGRIRHVVTPTGRVLFDPTDLDAAYRVVEPKGDAA